MPKASVSYIGSQQSKPALHMVSVVHLEEHRRQQLLTQHQMVQVCAAVIAARVARAAAQQRRLVFAVCEICHIQSQILLTTVSRGCVVGCHIEWRPLRRRCSVDMFVCMFAASHI